MLNIFVTLNHQGSSITTCWLFSNVSWAQAWNRISHRQVGLNIVFNGSGRWIITNNDKSVVFFRSLRPTQIVWGPEISNHRQPDIFLAKIRCSAFQNVCLCGWVQPLYPKVSPYNNHYPSLPNHSGERVRKGTPVWLMSHFCLTTC